MQTLGRWQMTDIAERRLFVPKTVNALKLRNAFDRNSLQVAELLESSKLLHGYRNVISNFLFYVS